MEANAHQTTPQQERARGETSDRGASPPAEPKSSVEGAYTLSLTGTGLKRASWTVVRILLLVAGVTTLAIPGDSFAPTFLGAAGAALIFAFLLWAECSRVFILWSAYLLGIVVFTHFRSLADDTFISTKYLYVIDFERLLFFGNAPTVWLQQRFHELGSITPFDTFMVWVHLSYFFMPYALAVALLFWSRRDFARYVGAVLATYYIGLVIYFLVPTSPPWLAGIEGYLPEVTRIVQVVSSDVSVESYEQGHRVVGANDVAAMPSLHFAITAVILLAHWHIHWILRVLTGVYLILMGLALVYLGEHYVTDLLVGFAVAIAGWCLARAVLDRYPLFADGIEDAASSGNGSR